jgi:hypothetical protein
VIALQLKSIGGIEILQTARIGGLIGLVLEFQESEGNLLSYDFSNVHLCFMMNARSCDCYDVDLQKARLELQANCSRSIIRLQENDFKGFHFSISIRVPMSTVTFSSTVFNLPWIYSTPQFIQFPMDSSADLTTIFNPFTFTLILPLTMNDIDRALILLTSLTIPSSNSSDNIERNAAIYELLIIVPDEQFSLLSLALQGFQSTLPFPFRLLTESILFPSLFTSSSSFDGYLLQMLIKLYIAEFIQTLYYITLDADIICLHPTLFTSFLPSSSSSSGSTTNEFNYRIPYHYESIDIHPLWWIGSAQLLQVSHLITTSTSASSTTLNEEQEEGKIGFGVTPAILSTWASLLVLYELQIRQQLTIYTMMNGFGITQIWSEYTLYRLTLEKYSLFSFLHEKEEKRHENNNNNNDHDNHQETLQLHCYNIWFTNQLPWLVREAKQQKNCLFSVIQSTANKDTSQLYYQVTQILMKP